MKAVKKQMSLESSKRNFERKKQAYDNMWLEKDSGVIQPRMTIMAMLWVGKNGGKERRR